MKVKVAQSCPTLCDPMDYTVHGILQARILEWVAFPFFRDLPNPGSESRSPTLQADPLLTEPQGMPKDTGVGSLSLLQQIFSTQDSNRSLLHCRRILYQLSYQGSPELSRNIFKEDPKMVSGPSKPRSTPDCNNQSYIGKYLPSAKCLTFISTLNSSK